MKVQDRARHKYVGPERGDSAAAVACRCCGWSRQSLGVPVLVAAGLGDVSPPGPASVVPREIGCRAWQQT
jgi:hypothetical protein